MTDRFRKKAVEIEAVQFDGDNAAEIKAFVGARPNGESAFLLPEEITGTWERPHVWNESQDSWNTVNPGDWIIRGVQGEFYPCEDSIFQATYEPGAARNPVEKIRDVRDIQGRDGTWNASGYMRGLYNGLELALSILEGEREPEYRDPPAEQGEDHADDQADDCDFVPPAAKDLPEAALDSATRGASAVDAAALTPEGRNLLAHALVQLRCDGWLHATEPDAATPGRGQNEPPSGLVEHAKRELELSGQWKGDPAYAQSIVAAVAAFASYGHSGGSASVAIEQLYRLLHFETLSPLTSDPAEWIDRSEISSAPLWQSVRDPKAFSADGGKTWYRLNDERAGRREDV